jgi:hypothetical protein
MDLENNFFSASFHWSWSVLVITIVIVLILLVTIFYLGLISWPHWMLWLKYLLRIVFITTIIFGIGYMPIRLEANDEKITLRRLFGALEVPLSTIVEIRQLSKSDIDGSIKTFGSDGLFGYLGKFKNNRLGNYTMYATELNNLILIKTNENVYIFSCTRYKELIKYVKSSFH